MLGKGGSYRCRDTYDDTNDRSRLYSHLQMSAFLHGIEERMIEDEYFFLVDSQCEENSVEVILP